MTCTGNHRLTLRILRNVSEIEELRGIWTEWESNPTTDIDYYISMVRLKPEIQSPYVMAVYRDGQVDSILVGRVERARVCFKVGYLRLFQPEVRELCFTHGGFLGNQSAENSEFVTREIVRCLGRGEADVARLDHMGIDSSLFEAAKAVPGILGRDFFAVTEPHGCLRLPGSHEEFARSLSRKERHHLKRHAEKVKADFPGEMRIQCFRQENEIEELVRHTEEVARKTYQRGLGVGFRDDPETRQWLRTAARKGSLRVCILYLKDAPCAFMIGLKYQQTLHGIDMGYDPQYAEYSLGSLLLMHWIEDAFEPNGSQSVTEIDLGPGDGRHKTAVNNHVSHESTVYIFAPTLKGLRFNLERTVTHLLDRAARKLLSAAFLEKIKKLWRSRAMGSGQVGHGEAIPVDE